MKKFIKYTSIFMSGLLVGGIAGHIVTKAKYELNEALAVEEARKEYAKKISDLEEKVFRQEAIEKETVKIKSSCEDGVCDIVYDEPVKVEDVQADVPVKEVKAVKAKKTTKKKVAKEPEYVDESLSTEYNPAELVEREYPYEIFKLDYERSKFHHDKQMVFFYKGDGILVNSEGDPIDVDYSTVGDDFLLRIEQDATNRYVDDDTIEEIIFPTVLQELSDEVFDYAFFIRNDRFQVDYEVVMLDAYYDDINAITQEEYNEEVEENGYVDEDGDVSYLEDAPEEEIEEDDEV